MTVKRLAAFLSTVALLSACAQGEKQAIAACEEFTKAKLAFPATFETLKTSALAKPAEAEISAVVQYRHASAYGVPIEGREICHFAMDGGRSPNAVEYAEKVAQARSRDESCCDGPTAIEIRNAVSDHVAEIEGAVRAVLDEVQE